MRFIRFLLILLSSFLSAGYSADPPPAAPVNVVTEIRVSVVHEGEVSQVSYTDSQTMKAILTYLRVLDPRGKFEFDPDTFRSDTYEFTLCYSDGTQTTYRQIHNEYLQKDDGIWQRISQKAGLLFPAL